MKLEKRILACCLTGMLFLPLQSLPQTALAGENQTEEELAPGFNACIENSSSVNDMRRCNADAIAYWQDKLDKALGRAKSLCGQANQPDNCLDYLNESQAAWQDYVEMAANYYMEANGGGSIGLVKQGYFRAKAIKAQVRILE